MRCNKCSTWPHFGASMLLLLFGVLVDVDFDFGTNYVNSSIVAIMKMMMMMWLDGCGGFMLFCNSPMQRLFYIFKLKNIYLVTNFVLNRGDI